MGQLLRATIFWGTQCQRTVRLSISCTPFGTAPKGRLLRIDLDKRWKTTKLFLLRQIASQKRSEIPSDIDKPLSFQRNMFDPHRCFVVVGDRRIRRVYFTPVRNVHIENGPPKFGIDPAEVFLLLSVERPKRQQSVYSATANRMLNRP